MKLIFKYFYKCNARMHKEFKSGTPKCNGPIMTII